MEQANPSYGGGAVDTWDVRLTNDSRADNLPAWLWLRACFDPIARRVLHEQLTFQVGVGATQSRATRHRVGPMTELHDGSSAMCLAQVSCACYRYPGPGSVARCEVLHPVEVSHPPDAAPALTSAG